MRLSETGHRVLKGLATRQTSTRKSAGEIYTSLLPIHDISLFSGHSLAQGATSQQLTRNLGKLGTDVAFGTRRALLSMFISALMIV